jgi:2-keto-4-pentenoate hydratase/2-oxohepta-3-ene-1,7-dioic acid hydratase in catechol pathway
MDFSLSPFGFFARTVYCLGRNFAQHAKELGNAVPSSPIVFLKPTASLCRTGWKITLPPDVGRVDHEVELVVALAGGGKHIDPEKALDFVAGYAVGIDVTARDLQKQAKDNGLPWALSKGFDTFAPLSDFIPRSEAGAGPFEFSLKVNGELKQAGSSKDMVFTVADTISYLSRAFTLNTGDLIFMGTPEGVGPLRSGDQVEAELQAGRVTLALAVE